MWQDTRHLRTLARTAVRKSIRSPMTTIEVVIKHTKNQLLVEYKRTADEWYGFHFLNHLVLLLLCNLVLCCLDPMFLYFCTQPCRLLPEHRCVAKDATDDDNKTHLRKNHRPATKRHPMPQTTFTKDTALFCEDNCSPMNSSHP